MSLARDNYPALAVPQPAQLYRFGAGAVAGGRTELAPSQGMTLAQGAAVSGPPDEAQHASPSKKAQFGEAGTKRLT